MQRKNTAFAATSVVLALGAALLGGVTSALAAQGKDGNNGEFKNVIYLLGDGMGCTHVTAGRERF